MRQRIVKVRTAGILLHLDDIELLCDADAPKATREFMREKYRIVFLPDSWDQLCFPPMETWGYDKWAEYTDGIVDELFTASDDFPQWSNDAEDEMIRREFSF